MKETMSVKVEVPAPRMRPAFDTIKEVHAGLLVDDMDKALHAACCAVAATGKAAKVTITLEIVPADKEVNTERVFFAGKVESKLPKLPRARSLFFLDENQNPTLGNPRQRDLELREVGGGEQPGGLREVG